jgi:hypothetical protein
MILLKLNGLTKKVSTGYSFKALLFGCFYPLFRGDYKGFARHFFYSSFTFGISWLFTPFFYNRKYVKELIEKGYKPANEESETYLMRKFDYES